MASRGLRIGIVGCGQAARVHVQRLRRREGVRIVGCADPDPAAARDLAALAADGGEPIPAYPDHKELIAGASPEAVAIFTPHLAHYRTAMDALQAGLHVFVEKPLSTNVQEAVDIVGLARGRGLTVAVGHQYRLLPTLAESRRRLAGGAIGPLRLVSATLAAPWLASHRGPEDSWRLDPKASGGGMLADAGVHLLDALLWTIGRATVEAAAFQAHDGGIDVVTAAAVRLADGVLATVGVSAVAPAAAFELTYFGERGRLRATDRALSLATADGPDAPIDLPGAHPSIDDDFVSAAMGDAPPCCPADQALDTVRLLEAIARSVATHQVVRLA